MIPILRPIRGWLDGKKLRIKVEWLVHGHASYTKTIETFELGNLVKEFNIISWNDDPYYEITTLESSSYPFFPCRGATLQSRPRCYCWHASCFLTYHTEGNTHMVQIYHHFFLLNFQVICQPLISFTQHREKGHLSWKIGKHERPGLSSSYPFGTSRQ